MAGIESTSESSRAGGTAARARIAFLYCDYWASILGLRGVVRRAAIECGRINPPLFRAYLDRPETRLPGLRSYLLTLVAGPVLIPYRVVQHARSKLRLHLLGAEDAAALLEPCALRVEPQNDGRVRVESRGETLARDLFDPGRAEVVFSLVYPTYKLLFSALVAIVLTVVSEWALRTGHAPATLETLVRFAHYPFVVFIAWLLFRDVITAVAGPLPVYLVVAGMALTGSLSEPRPQMFIGALVALAVAYFFVDGFLVPRGLEPTLYYYATSPADPAHPYEPGQAPTWLAARAYWVWRFVYCTSAELNKVWERDWERVEAWVPAEGPHAGEIEWLVVDFHYRELWLPRERLVSPGHAREQGEALARVRAGGPPIAWIVETDMNVVFHSPEVRGVHVMPLAGGWELARFGQLWSSLQVDSQPDRPADYRPGVQRLRALGHDVVEDIPEHFRGYALRQLLTTPWRYWRYPRGANTASRPYVYSRDGNGEPLLATEPDLQIKSNAEGSKT